MIKFNIYNFIAQRENSNIQKPALAQIPIQVVAINMLFHLFETQCVKDLFAHNGHK